VPAPQVLEFFGTPLVIEPSPETGPRDGGLHPCAHPASGSNSRRHLPLLSPAPATRTRPSTLRLRRTTVVSSASWVTRPRTTTEPWAPGLLQTGCRSLTGGWRAGSFLGVPVHHHAGESGSSSAAWTLRAAVRDTELSSCRGVGRAGHIDRGGLNEKPHVLLRLYWNRQRHSLNRSRKIAKKPRRGLYPGDYTRNNNCCVYNSCSNSYNDGNWRSEPSFVTSRQLDRLRLLPAASLWQGSGSQPAPHASRG